MSGTDNNTAVISLTATDVSGSTAPFPTHEQFGKWVRFNRHQLGMSLADVGDALGVTRQAVAHWEKSGIPPSLDRVIKLWELFRSRRSDKTADVFAEVENMLAQHAGNTTRT
jgi:DNA-binding XRE family transcriptional regulator